MKPFGSMTARDYEAIGLRCGLEVHQQLLTRTKLFCRCPAGHYSSEYDAEILRHMRPTLSELGEYDGTALMEKKTRKNIYYRLNSHTVCTYEFDDTPPFFMADDAMDIALELALFLNLNMVGELHIARKQYLDGTIPTGFQRTTILGVDGWLPYKKRRIGVAQLGLEEDACREVSDTEHDRVLLTDRLGMPLIEVVTTPDMRTPEETAEVCEVIRRLCRSTGKVRTGYGAAREDVNVSVRGGTRIEIKGVPRISRIPRLVYNEARRQCSLLAIRDKLKQRGITAETLRCRFSDVTAIVARTHYGPMRAALADGRRVKCVVLKNFAGLLVEPTQENTTFAKEFSDRIRVIACLTKLPNMVHSDIASESLYGKDWQKLRQRLRAGEQDALILVWGNDRDTQTACEEIDIRAREATIGIPSDTRQPFKDGTNGFERVLPGAERMYPDTDLPPVEVEETRLARIRAHLPMPSWEREDEGRKRGLQQPDMLAQLSVSPRAALFFRVVDELDVSPTFAGVVLLQALNALKRSGNQPDRLPDDKVFAVFEAFSRGMLARDGVVLVIRHLLRQTARRAMPATDGKKTVGWAVPTDDGKKCKGGGHGPPYLLPQGVQGADGAFSVDAIVAAMNLEPLPAESFANRIRMVLGKLDQSRFDSTAQIHRHIMGCLMAEARGRVNGAQLAHMVTQALKPLLPQGVPGSPS